jgi:hypothetical protein
MAVGDSVDRYLREIEANLVAWRRDFHQHPELGNRETRTSGIVAAHLERLGLKVMTGIAHTGVVAVLEGARPGPVIGLRADMSRRSLSFRGTNDVQRRVGRRDARLRTRRSHRGADGRCRSARQAS